VVLPRNLASSCPVLIIEEEDPRDVMEGEISDPDPPGSVWRYSRAQASEGSRKVHNRGRIG